MHWKAKVNARLLGTVRRSFVREWRGDAREVERDERRAIVIARETLERGEIVVGL